MLRYQVLQGVSLTGATGLPTISRTPEGIAMGSVPGWSLLFDPGKRQGERVSNRVVAGEYLSPYSSSPDPFTFGTFANGEPCLTLSGDDNALNPAVRLNEEAWTFFTVFEMDSEAEGEHQFAHASPGFRDSEPYLRLSIGGQGRASMLYGGGLTSRVAATPDVAFAGRVALIMFTFSTREGCRIYIDGKLGGHSPEETEPLASGFGADEWYLLDSTVQGKVGMIGLLDIDLGWPEHAGYRRNIERFLMDKYGIT